MGDVMLFRVLSVAVLAAVSGLSSASAQTAGDFSGPSELPPSGYSAQQYVDSKGCVFLRVGYGGRTSWVPQVSADRKPLCGYPASIGGKAPAAAQVAVAPEAAKPAAAASAGAKAPALRAKPKSQAIDSASYVAPRPANLSAGVAPARLPAAGVPVAGGTAVAIVPSVAGRGKIGCHRSVPVPVIVRLRDGGLATVCTRGDGTLEGARAPVYPHQAGVGASLGAPVRAATAPVATMATVANNPAVPPAVAKRRVVMQPAMADDPWRRDPPMFGAEGYAVSRTAMTLAPPPEGYIYAWKDDRLNPNRSVGTASGQAAQDAVWTRKVPARLVAGAGTGVQQGVAIPVSGVTVSTKSPPADVMARPGPGSFYIQVGSFGVTSNAQNAAARLAGLGLPAGQNPAVIGGKTLQAVYAGPFASAAAAQGALVAVRGAGFADAYIR